MADEPPDGFAQFVATRSPALLRTAWLLTGDAGKAEDLLQTALAAAWRRWREVPPTGDPVAYVRRTMVNLYASWWRRRWRGEVPTADLPEPPAAADVAGTVANRDAVRRALARLSRQQRAIVVLRYVEDLSVDETARVLGCSPGTVRVQAFRALAALRADPDLRLPQPEEVGK